CAALALKPHQPCPPPLASGGPDGRPPGPPDPQACTPTGHTSSPSCTRHASQARHSLPTPHCSDCRAPYRGPTPVPAAWGRGPQRRRCAKLHAPTHGNQRQARTRTASSGATAWLVASATQLTGDAGGDSCPNQSLTYAVPWSAVA